MFGILSPLSIFKVSYTTLTSNETTRSFRVGRTCSSQFTRKVCVTFRARARLYGGLFIKQVPFFDVYVLAFTSIQPVNNLQ